MSNSHEIMSQSDGEYGSLYAVLSLWYGVYTPETTYKELLSDLPQTKNFLSPQHPLLSTSFYIFKRSTYPGLA